MSFSPHLFEGEIARTKNISKRNAKVASASKHAVSRNDSDRKDVLLEVQETL